MSDDENQPAYYAYEGDRGGTMLHIVLGVLGLHRADQKMESERYVQRYLNILPLSCSHGGTFPPRGKSWTPRN